MWPRKTPPAHLQASYSSLNNKNDEFLACKSKWNATQKTYSSQDPEAAGIHSATTYPIECTPSEEEKTGNKWKFISIALFYVKREKEFCKICKRRFGIFETNSRAEKVFHR